MKNILIWDSQEPCPKSADEAVLWSQYNSSKSNKLISIPELIEKNANSLKARYLTWIYDLGLTKAGNSTIIETLKIRENLSYWWMTPIAEKFNYSKSPHITDAIRFLAFEELCQSFRVESILLVTNNYSLIKCMELHCQKAKLKFEWKSSPDKVTKVSIKKLIARALPNKIKIFIWLSRYVFKRLPFRSFSAKAWYNSDAKLTFFSYFTNLTQKSQLEGRFESNYWAHLPEVLLAAKKQTNWLHIYVEDSFDLNYRSVNKLIKKFNLNNNQNHILLDSFLNLRILLRSLIQWHNLQSRLRKINDSLSYVTSGKVNLWPLFQTEFKKKTISVSLLENILMLNLFESILSNLPKQNCGVYIFEQQPWEIALISAWKTYSHSKLIGMQHSTVLFWDLRYFHDPRTYKFMSSLKLPMPDKIAVNGPVAKQTLIDSGYPGTDLELTEALRYLYLEQQVLSKRTRIKRDPMRLLVLGDYDIGKTKFQLSLLEKSLKLLTFDPKVIIKLHPVNPINNYTMFEISKKNLSELLLEADVVFTSSTTSGAIDAYCIGLPIISILDPVTLNLSPLRSFSGVIYVNTPQQLSAAINHVRKNYAPPTDKVNYFTLGNSLPKWKTILHL